MGRAAEEKGPPVPVWWDELLGILAEGDGGGPERGTKSRVLKALAHVELNGINLAPLLRLFTPLHLRSTPTELIVATRLQDYPVAVQDGVLSLVLAQLQRLPAPLVRDFVVAYAADAKPSPMAREWTRRLVCRIIQQLMSLEHDVELPLRLKAVLGAADREETEERYRIGADRLSGVLYAGVHESSENDDDDEEAESLVLDQVIYVPDGDDIIQDLEWDMSEQPQQRRQKRKGKETKDELKRRRLEHKKTHKYQRRKTESSDDENLSSDDNQAPQDVSIDLLELEQLTGDGEEEYEDAESILEQDKPSDAEDDPAHAERGTGIAPDLVEQIVALRKELQQIGQEGKIVPANHPALELLQSQPKLEPVLEHLLPKDLSDEAIAFLCNRLFSASDISFKRCSTLISGLILPKAFMLERSVSRVLSTAIYNIAKQHPSSLISALLVPLISAPALGVPQSDIINRVLKDCFDASSVLQFLKAFLNASDSGEDDSISLSQSMSQSQDIASVVIWTENTIAVLQTVIDTKEIALPPDTFEQLLVQLDRHATYFTSNLKFSALVLAIITKHGKLVAESKAFVEQIVEKGSTFMKKAALAKLAKLGS